MSSENISIISYQFVPITSSDSHSVLPSGSWWASWGRGWEPSWRRARIFWAAWRRRCWGSSRRPAGWCRVWTEKIFQLKICHFRNNESIHLGHIIHKFLRVTKVITHIGESEVHELEILILVETARRWRLYLHSWLVDGGKILPGSERQSSHSAISGLHSDPPAVLGVEIMNQGSLVIQAR